MLEKQIDDAQLLSQRPRSAAGAGGPHSQMKRRRAAVLQNAICSSPQSEQLKHGRRASGANRPVKSRGPASVDPVDLRSALHQKLDQRGLPWGAPCALEPWPRVASVVQRSPAASIPGVRVGPCLEQKPGDLDSQAGRGKVQARVADVEPVWYRLALPRERPRRSAPSGSLPRLRRPLAASRQQPLNQVVVTALQRHVPQSDVDQGGYDDGHDHSPRDRSDRPPSQRLPSERWLTFRRQPRSPGC